MRLSVVVCTHNPKREFFERMLEGLRQQTLSPETWELLVVDNASNPALSEEPVSWHPLSRLVREEQLGLTPARLRGIRETIGPALVFVDDDNVLDPEYLRLAAEIVESFPQLGAFGGQCIPEFMGFIPPEWTRRYWKYLAIREFSDTRWGNVPDWDVAPIGAGLVLRREVADYYLHLLGRDERRRGVDRKGNSLSSGGDSDMAFCACDLGLGIGRLPELQLVHLMPEGRFTQEYLLKLIRAMYCSAKVVWSFRIPLPPERERTPIQKLRRKMRYLLGRGEDREFQFGLAAENGLRDADEIIAGWSTQSANRS